MRPVIDLTGKTFGYLLVIERAGSNKYGSALWLCRCECGTVKAIEGRELRGDDGPRSCGCAGRMRWFDKCKHEFPIGHELRYPDGVKYGSLSVCIRCRARRVVDWDAWLTRIMPPVPRDFDGPSIVVELMNQ